MQPKKGCYHSADVSTRVSTLHQLGRQDRHDGRKIRRSLVPPARERLLAKQVLYQLSYIPATRQR